MKVIIAGGRDYVFDALDFEMLNQLHDRLRFTAVVSGGAGRRDRGTTEVLAGADLFGEVWAARNLLVVDRFYVTKEDWARLGPRAGPLRNKAMAEHVARAGGCAVLFPGGKGTESMRLEAWHAKIPFLVRDKGYGWTWICASRRNLKSVAASVPLRVKVESIGTINIRMR